MASLPNLRTSDFLPCHLIFPLLEASRALKPSFYQVISSIRSEENGGRRRPVSLICGLFFGWTVEIANRLVVFLTLFLPNGTFGIGMYFLLWLKLPHAGTTSDSFEQPDFAKVGAVHRSQFAFYLK